MHFECTTDNCSTNVHSELFCGEQGLLQPRRTPACATRATLWEYLPRQAEQCEAGAHF